MKATNLLLLLLIFLLTYLILINVKADIRPQIAINEIEANKLLKQKYYDYIIDVRTDKEWSEGRFPGAIHIPLKDLEDGVKLYTLNSNYLVYCKTGRRAHAGALIMKNMGFTNVHYLVGDYRRLT